MAWLEQRGKTYRLSFRYQGTVYRHSLGTRDKAEAAACLARLEDSLNRLERGWLQPSAGVDLPIFLLSGGEVAQRPTVTAAPSPLRLGALSARYLETQATSLEKGSLATLGIHLRHLDRTLGAEFAVQGLTLGDLQRHVDRRRKQPGRRGPVKGYTIRKEINALSAAWDWAVQSNLMSGTYPSQGLRYPKSEEKVPFRTRAEIERVIERGELVGDAVKKLWDCLFLTLPETADLLEYVAANARQGFIYPMVCFAAHTGARRSEMLRSQVTDIDFDSGTVLIREKKRVKGKTTTRQVPLSPFLAGEMRKWVENHPGGVHTFCHAPRVFRSKTARQKPLPVTRDEAHDHFKRTLDAGKWAVVRGWHVLRHSFISNCAARGVDQRLIDAWVGHTTEEMRRRYRHLLPDQSASAIRSVFDGQ
jgi:integrase